MLTLKRSADPNSLDIYREDKHIGYLQTHKERPDRVVLTDSFSYLSITEMQFLCDEYKSILK